MNALTEVGLHALLAPPSPYLLIGNRQTI